MATPLVTVITPCFDDDATLPMALASLVAQTFQDWECVVIDDGSARKTAPIVESFFDGRIRHYSFTENRGRPVARQKGLEKARGEFICMLDADDWYYPWKLERQLQVMEENPDLTALSTGMAVIDGDSRLTGVRAFSEKALEVRRCLPPRPPRLAFSPIIIRREEALAHRFDPRLKRSEDPDYLMKVLKGRYYGVMNEPAYVYREEFSHGSMGEALHAFRYQRMVFARHLRSAPREAARQYLLSLVKTGVYGAARAAGRGRWLFDRRNREASVAQMVEFWRCREVVAGELAQCLPRREVRLSR